MLLINARYFLFIFVLPLHQLAVYSLILRIAQGWDSLDSASAAESLSITLKSLGKLRDAGELLQR